MDQAVARADNSSLCRNRTWGSCGGINRLGFGQHFVMEKPAEAQRRVEVHLASAEQRGQFEQLANLMVSPDFSDRFAVLIPSPRH